MTHIRFLLTVILLVGLYFTSYSQYDSISYNSLYRTYLLHIPPSYVPGNPVSLVVAMHGGFGSGPQLQTQSQLSVKSDNEGFIVVYPEGVESPFGIRTWNAGGCCGYAMNNNIDDVGFLSALIDTLIADYTIDTNRIYATGMSNGAFMSYRLACEKSNRIAAIAPMAGSMNVNICAPLRAVPVIHFHSYQDNNVPYQGGIGAGVSNHYNPPLDSVLNVWSGFSNCIFQNDTLLHDTDYTHINWSGCDCGNKLHLYLTQDGGHSWPGVAATSAGDPVSTVINANDLMWDFFQQHSLDCSTSGIEELVNDNYLKVYPNPLKNFATIELSREIINGEIVIRNIFGQQVKTIQGIDKNKFILHRGHLSHGLYFVQLIKKGEIISTNKIIIID
jgi:polyhydroxybutyrate depolymerase